MTKMDSSETTEILSILEALRQSDECDNPTHEVIDEDIPATSRRAPFQAVMVSGSLAIELHAQDVASTRAERTVWTYIYRRLHDETGQDTAMVHRKGTDIHYVMQAEIANKLSPSAFMILSSTEAEDPDDTDDDIPRPRNAFMLYRQWISDRLAQSHPGLPASTQSFIIAEAWNNDLPATRSYFKELSEQEKRIHALKYPGYRYRARRVRCARRDRLPHAPISKRFRHDPMAITGQFCQVTLQALAVTSGRNFGPKSRESRRRSQAWSRFGHVT
ncbi:hypothetical protein OQA88_13712 [Cercophora sp. LCS_1]